MKKHFSKVFSIFLAVIMIITVVPFASLIGVSAASTATYDKEYYYPAGTALVSDLAVSTREYSTWSSGRRGDCTGYLTNNGWTLIDKDCNSGKSKSDYIYVGYKTTTDESQAIRAVACYNGGNAPDTYEYTINGHVCTFYLVKNGYDNSSSLSNKAIDLNKDAGGDYIYLYYTKDPNAGPPIVGFTANDSASTSGYYPVTWMNAGLEGTTADLNRQAGGDYIYFHYAQTGTAVDTSALHSAIDNGNSYLANSSRYASVSALQTAVNNAQKIADDYNADGLSDEYAQVTIDEAAKTITNAINGLQTTVYLNANGGSVGTSSFAVNIGSSSNATADVSSYVPTRTGYTFKGWSTSSTATSGSTSTVDVGFNTTLYATWEANKYNVYFDNGLYVSTVTFGGTYGTLPTPEKEGHTFAGWFKADGEKLNSDDSVEANDIYVTSDWTKNQYTITWVRANGRVSTDVYEYGAKIDVRTPTATDKNEAEHFIYEWDAEIDEFATRDVTYTEIKKSEAHNLTEILYNEPTCEEDGLRISSCSGCSYLEETVIPALGHTEKITTVDATCEKAGSVTVICTVCGETVSTEVIPAKGHSMSDWEVSKYPTETSEGLKVKTCADCGCEETEVLKPVKLRTTRIISSEINGNTIRITGYTNADSIAFYRTTAAGEDIIFDMFYDEEDLANEPTPIKYGDNSPRWIIYNSRWEQYAVNGKYTDKVTIAGVEYNFEVVMVSRDLDANDVVLTEKFANITVDNANKVITIVPSKGATSVTLKETSRQYDEFTYTINADNYANVIHNAVSGAYRGSYTINANGQFETEVAVTVNNGKYCQEDYTLKVIFLDFDLVNELKPLRGTVSVETYEDGSEFLKVTMSNGQSSTGIYKTGKSSAVSNVKVELDDGIMTEKDNLYVGYVSSNKVNPTGVVTVTLSNGSVLAYDIVFDMGIEESVAIDPVSELRLIRATASVDADGTIRITRNSGLATSAGAGLYSTTTAGQTITFTTEQGVIYSGRTDAFIAYLSQNTSNVKGVISYTLSDGTVVTLNVVIDLGLGDEYVEPEEPAYDVAGDLKVIRGTVSESDGTVTITVASGKTMTGVYAVTDSGATVEITDVNGAFAERTDAYVAYVASNSANVEGVMIVTLADGTVYEYNVIFDLGL